MADPTFDYDSDPPFPVRPTAEYTVPTVTLPPFPTVTTIEYIPSIKKNIITFVSSQFYGIHTPCDWQIEAIHYALFVKYSLLVANRKTADGKSIPPLTVDTVKCRVMAILVPLVGLDSDQVEKSVVSDHNIEAYHADEYEDQDV